MWYKKENRSEIKKNLGFNESDFLIGSFQRDTEGKDLISPKLIKGPDIFVELLEKHFDKNAFFTENYNKWRKLPLLIRPILLFIYRYFLKQGFRLGINGFFYIFFHTLIYRTYIDFLILRILVKKYLKL